MSQNQPLMTNAIEPTAPAMSYEGDNNGTYNGPPPGQDMAPPAYTMPAAYAPGQAGQVPPRQDIISQQPQQTNPSSYQPQYAPQQGQPQQYASQPQQYAYQPQPQRQVPQYVQPQAQYVQAPQYVQPQAQAQYNNHGCGSNQAVNYNDGNYHPSVDRAVAAPASGGITPGTTTVVVVGNNGYAPMGGGGAPRPHPPVPMRGGGYDDPCCIYVFAIIALFFPIIGFFAMCCLNCGNGFGPRRAMAYRRLVIFTIIGFIINVIFFWNNEDWWEDENEGNQWNN